MVACATDASNSDESDAGDNGPSYADQYVSHSDGGLDATIPPDQDVYVPPPDDTGPPPDAPSACGVVGAPCDTHAGGFPPVCGLFFQCQNALGGLDAGTPDGGGADSGDGGDAGDADAGPPPPPVDGVCMPSFDVGFAAPCNNGTDHCPAGSMCLLASQICLTPADTACICNNPGYGIACGNP